jgi:hypothetical protein
VGLILSEPIKKVVEIPKMLMKMSIEDAKIHPKRPYDQNLPSKKPAAKKPAAKKKMPCKHQNTPEKGHISPITEERKQKTGTHNTKHTEHEGK